jgi:hypothetical protein
MFPLAIRVPLIVLTLAFGIYHLPSSPTRGAVYLFACALLVVGHFRYGTVWFAFRAFRRGNLPKARRLLARVRNPDHLSSRFRAYYDWMQGAFAIDDGEPEKAIDLLDRAFTGGLQTDHARCGVALLMATALLDMGDRETATEVLERARTIAHRPSLRPVFESLEARLADGGTEG